MSKQSPWPEWADRLIDGYHALRKDSSIRDHDARFEGISWRMHPTRHGMMRRSNDGYDLLLYYIEGDIEARVIAPNGESTTYA